MKSTLTGLILGLLLAAAAGGAYWFGFRDAGPPAPAGADGPLPSLTGPGGNSRYIPPAAETTDRWIDEGSTQVRDLAPRDGARADDAPLRIIDADADPLAGIPEIDADTGGPSDGVTPVGGGGAVPPAETVNRIDPDAARPGLAVIPFKQSTTVQEPEAGITLANVLLSEIDSDRYTLFERGQLAALLQEARFQESDLVDTSRAIQFGRLSGIRYLVIGELSSLGGVIRWTARVVDCQTGAIGDKGSVRFNHFREVDRGINELVALLGLNEALAAAPRPEPGPPAGPIHVPSPTQPGSPAPAPERRRLTGNDLIDAFNPQAPFGLTLATGQNKTRYTEGEPLSFRVTADTDGYLTLLTVDPAGDITLLLPNRWQPRAFVRRGEPLTLPTAQMNFKFTVQPPHGQTLVKALITTRPLRLRGVDPARLQREGLVAGGNLAQGTKAIGLEGTGASPGTTHEPAMLGGQFASHEWATAELAITTTAGLAQAPVAPPVTAPSPAPATGRDPLVPVTRGTDPNDALLDTWAAIARGQGGTKSLGHGTPDPARPRSGPMFPDAQPHDRVSGLLVIRRPAAGTKNLNAAHAGPGAPAAGGARGYTTQRVPLATGTKTLGRGGGWRQQAAALEQADPDVVAAIPDRRVRAFGVVPNTRFAPAQWALRNQANPGFDTAWHRVADLAAPSRTPLIGVVDQGLDPDDPRLAALAWTNPREVPNNGRDDDGNGLIDDVHGYHFTRQSGNLKNPGAPLNHGSYVASIIACRPLGRADDLIGIAPGARIVSGGGLAYDPELKTPVGSDADIFDAIAYVADQGAKIINLSLGSGGDKTKTPYTAQDIAKYNAHPVWDRLERDGVLVVIAAGNQDTDNDAYPVLPGNLATLRPNVITVMAIDPAGLRGRGYNPKTRRWEAYSNHGKTSVHLAAPGTSILGVPNPGTTAAYDGTSFAAPIVTGAAALVWGQHPEWDYRTVRRAILESTRPVVGLEDQCITGGMLDLEAALNWRP